MAIPEGLRTALNAIRETSIQDGTLYHQYVPEILPDTDVGSFAAPIVADQTIANEFMSRLVKRIVYTIVESKLFRNKLEVLKGDNLPLGAIGQEIYVNPIKGRRFDVDALLCSKSIFTTSSVSRKFKSVSCFTNG